jgi:hypothetical protein
LHLPQSSPPYPSAHESQTSEPAVPEKLTQAIQNSLPEVAVIALGLAAQAPSAPGR